MPACTDQHAYEYLRSIYIIMNNDCVYSYEKKEKSYKVKRGYMSSRH